MMALFIMFAQKIFAVVVAVGSAHDYMDVILVGLFVLAKRDTPLVVELNDDHRALDAIIENAVVIHAAHPAKIAIVQLALYLFHLQPRMVGAHAADVMFHQPQ